MLKIILIILAILYALNPYDIFPDFFVGWGWLDDIVILGLLWRYLYSQNKTQSGFKNYFKQNQEFNRDRGNAAHPGQDNAGTDSRFENNDDRWDPYRVLEIARNASAEEIKKSYRRLANQYHPDKVEHLGREFKELAEKRFKEIQRAYQELSNK